MTMDTSCLYSTIQNTSGVAKTFGFLPPHGRKLTANEEFTVFGDVRQAIIRDERATNRRNIVAFEDAIARGDLVILSTPSPILVDATTGDSKMLSLDNTTLGTVDPCWLDSVSE